MRERGVLEPPGRAPSARSPTGTSYGDRLVDEGWTPVYLRVNTGLPIAENGVALAALMERLVECWPPTYAGSRWSATRWAA